jgi:hypothetical protein
MSFPSLISTSALAFVGTALLALPSQGFAANATAAQSTTKACATQYQAAKTAGTLNGKKWPQYLSDCSATMNNGAAAAPVAATAAMAAQPKTMMKQTTAMAPAAKTVALAAAGHQTTQQICSTQYQAAKSANTLKGQKWPQFLTACADSIKNDKSDASNVPPEPAQPTAATSMQSAMPVTNANGKALTPGEVAFRQRIHECSTQWQSQKSSGTLPAGTQWPQFWSSCNTRLKAQG